MTHRLQPLPEPLLRQLGCAADEHTLSEVLQPYKPSQAGLFRTQSNEPYAAATGQPGLSLMVQHQCPAAPRTTPVGSARAEFRSEEHNV